MKNRFRESQMKCNLSISENAENVSHFSEIINKQIKKIEICKPCN